MNQKLPLTIGIAFLLIAAVAPQATAADGGGDIDDIAPQATAGLTGNVGSVNNLQAHVETYTFTLYDANGAADIEAVRIISTDATFATKTCTDVTVGTSCPDWSFSLGGPGYIDGSFTYTWPAGQAAGTETQTLSFKDDGAYTSNGASTDQTIFSDEADLTISGSVYDINGAVVAKNWGWDTASPGDTNVPFDYFRYAVNDGTGDAQLTISWTGTDWEGSGESTAIDNNSKFSTGTGTDPIDGMTPGSTDADGSASFTLTPGQHMWFGMQVDAFPEPLDHVTLTAAYTITDTT